MTVRNPGPLPEIVVDERGERDGGPVLLLHGGGVAGWMWRPLIEQMGPGHRFLVPDLPGHDRGAQTDYESHERTVDALAEMLQHREDRPAAVIGFSLGAQLAVLLAVRRPDLVAQVGIISAQAEPSRWPGMTLALLRTAAPLAKWEWFARAQAKELFIPPTLFPDYLRTARRLSTRTLLTSVGENMRFTVPPAWASYAGTTLVLVGERERAIMARSAHHLTRDRGDGDSETIAGCGHGAPLQKPRWLADRLQAWLT
ncbi:alpha/beta fold hydrolase [Marinitenerispora sediminis]|uniref:Alpha/beta hydrolase n=1 Tax=Marinitenerispora sediminis TaxID=1931232 RepID=A0A368T3K2_9ACTN|nr:alpha/beta hydrolase [Marinitenerispora sediminis]RCV49370.1 alpha/beta hydrolase [Marinitenerispora sediminis]RCV55989.1 alpha/beta hydrolase [Marinitenerispora sediminis]RCV56604.1 alpha/beta hydrolase [Marinitenerispora sediminis]